MKLVPSSSLPSLFNQCAWLVPVLAILSLTSIAQAVPSVVNPNFDSSISNTYTVNSSHAGNGWYAPGDTSWSRYLIQDGNAAVRDPNITAQVANKKSLLQVINDGQSTTGGAGFIFSVLSDDAGSANELVVEVYGVNSFSSGFTTGGNAVDGNAVLLGMLNTYLAGQEFTRTRYYMPVDFESGYNYIVLKFTAKLTNTSSVLAVDSVSFVTPTNGTLPTFPFPQAVEYPYGFKPSNYNQVSQNKHVQDTWENFQDTYFTQTDTVYDGEWRVSRVNQGDDTVSEGIGYGMLFCVLMDNAENNTRPLFDGLYNYYLRRLNSNGLMNWQYARDEYDNLPAPYTTDKADAADADEDVALALVFAHLQWGSDDGIPYLDQARILINRLEDKVCKANSYNLFQSGSKATGDYWQNISYYAPAWYRVFASVTGSTYWTSTVIPSCYTEIEYFYDNNDYDARGLVPDWHDPRDYGPATSHPNYSTGKIAYEHKYDACRVGWRIGTDYLWYGTTSDALAYDSPYAIAEYLEDITSNDPTDITTYSIPAGTKLTNYNVTSLTAPVGVAAMVSSNFTSWRNQIYTALVTEYQQPDYDAYFARCLQLLSMLTMTGNFPNLWEREPSLIDDGGFEEGGTAWSFPANAYIASYNMNSGNYSARMNGNGAWSTIGQSVAVSANTEYECTGYLRTLGLDASASAKIRIRWYNSSWGLLGTSPVGEIGPNDFYTYKKALVTSPTNAAIARVELVITASTSGTAYFDDIRLRHP